MFQCLPEMFECLPATGIYLKLAKSAIVSELRNLPMKAFDTRLLNVVIHL